MSLINLCRVAPMFVLSLAGLAAPASAASPDGLYLMTRVWGSSIETKVWLFRGNQFAQQPVGDLQRFDFAAAARQAPGAVGRVAARGDEWTLTWADGDSRTARHQPASAGCFYWDAGLFCPVKAFASGERLQGRWSGGLGGGGAGASRSISFTPDGRYQMSALGSVSTSGALVGAFAASGSAEEGRYELGGNVLRLVRADGQQRQLLTFPYDDAYRAGRVPQQMYLDGFMLKLSAGSAPAATAAAAGGRPGAAECPATFVAGGVDTLTCQCSADAAGRESAVWGSGPYTNDSSPCRAAVHAGAIGLQGGRITLDAAPGAPRFTGSTRNGVTTRDYGSWPGAFRVRTP